MSHVSGLYDAACSDLAIAKRPMIFQQRTTGAENLLESGFLDILMLSFGASDSFFNPQVQTLQDHQYPQIH